jgi:hypothetical protein
LSIISSCVNSVTGIASLRQGLEKNSCRSPWLQGKTKKDRKTKQKRQDSRKKKTEIAKSGNIDAVLRIDLG